MPLTLNTQQYTEHQWQKQLHCVAVVAVVWIIRRFFRRHKLPAAVTNRSPGSVITPVAIK